jgi:hypothetical protein
MAGPTSLNVTNNALVQLGALPINSFHDGSQVSDTARELYPTARDTVLELAAWNFACFYATLTHTPLLDPPYQRPVWKWVFQYPLTTDPYCLRVLDMENHAEFEVGGDRFEGRVLMTNEATGNIRYVGRVEDLGHWNALAVEALTKYLAAELAPLVTGQATRKAALLQEFQAMLGSAVDRDSHENFPQAVPPNRLLALARHRSGGPLWSRRDGITR